MEKLNDANAEQAKLRNRVMEAEAKVEYRPPCLECQPHNALFGRRQALTTSMPSSPTSADQALNAMRKLQDERLVELERENAARLEKLQEDYHTQLATHRKDAEEARLELMTVNRKLRNLESENSSNARKLSHVRQ